MPLTKTLDNLTEKLEFAAYRPRILIVDDQVINIQALHQIFASDHEVFMATSGQSALDFCRKTPPDLILLDIMMPKIDGLEVARRLKADTGLPFIPIIMVTAKTTAKDVLAGLEAGGDDYLTKPIDHGALIVRVRAMLRIKDEFGRLDILVNNAGIYPTRPFFDESSDEAFWNKVYDVNVNGTMLCTQVVGRKLRAQGEGGSIVNIASIAAVVPHADALVAYGASKAGLVNATRTLAKSLAPHGIRVNAVLPGGMDTDGVVDNPARRSGADIPLGWRAHPDEVAVAVLFLAAPIGGYVTGASLVVDGGAALK